MSDGSQTAFRPPVDRWCSARFFGFGETFVFFAEGSADLWPGSDRALIFFSSSTAFATEADGLAATERPGVSAFEAPALGAALFFKDTFDAFDFAGPGFGRTASVETASVASSASASSRPNRAERSSVSSTLPAAGPVFDNGSARSKLGTRSFSFTERSRNSSSGC